MFENFILLSVTLFSTNQFSVQTPLIFCRTDDLQIEEHNDVDDRIFMANEKTVWPRDLRGNDPRGFGQGKNLMVRRIPLEDSKTIHLNGIETHQLNALNKKININSHGGSGGSYNHGIGSISIGKENCFSEICEQSVKPGKTKKPGKPRIPGKPGKPGKPEKPGKPGKPEKPGKKPGKPEKPGKKPGKPGKPRKTGKPGKPEKPGKPVKPGIPGKPGTPGKPRKPGKPGIPGKPGKPEKAGEKPGNPGKTRKPGKPGKPGKNLGKTGKPGKPEKPETPGKPEKPEEPAKPGKPGNCCRTNQEKCCRSYLNDRKIHQDANQWVYD